MAYILIPGKKALLGDSDQRPGKMTLQIKVNLQACEDVLSCIQLGL
jgi:hypothetical protein